MRENSQGASVVPELPPAEPLADGVRQREGLLIELFGDEVVGQLHSKTWSLRQAAVNAIADTLPSLGVEPRQAAAACVRVLNKTAADKMVQVFLASTPLLALLCQLSAAAGTPRAALLADAQPVLEAWREKLHDANARARAQTADALLAASDASQLGAAAVAAVLVEKVDPKKGSSSQLWLSRLSLLLRVIAEHGDELRDKLPAAIELIKGALDHRDQAVRAKATEVACAAYPLLADLTAVQRILWPGMKSGKGKPVWYDALMAALDEAMPTSGAPSRSGSVAPSAPPAPRRARRPRRARPGARRPRVRSRRRRPRRRRRCRAPAAATGAPPAEAEAAAGEEGEGEYEDDPFTCQFCGLYDPSFTEEKLDMHFWKDCPLLTSCRQCDQVIEVQVLNEHLRDECERVHGGDAYKPPLGTADFSGCPLCMQPLPDTPEAWQHHLIEVCVANERRQQQA